MNYPDHLELRTSTTNDTSVILQPLGAHSFQMCHNGKCTTSAASDVPSCKVIVDTLQQPRFLGSLLSHRSCCYLYYLKCGLHSCCLKYVSSPTAPATASQTPSHACEASLNDQALGAVA